MGKNMKKSLITAVVLVGMGAIMFAATMSVNKWDFTILNTVKYESNTHEIGEDFNKIMFDTDTADITFIPTNDGKCKVICYEIENVKHSVKVKDGALKINEVDTRKWYEYIGITVDTPRITVELPKTEYASLDIKESTGNVKIRKGFKFDNVSISVSTGDVEYYSSAHESIKIKASTGDIRIKDISAGKIDLSVSTGNITAKGISCKGDIKTRVSTGKTTLTDITCNTVNSNGTTGDIILENVRAKKDFSIKRDTGDIRIKDCDANELFIETTTGDVKGTLLSDKVFITQTDTGSIDVPKTASGGRCEITTDTGDIKISIK